MGALIIVSATTIYCVLRIAYCVLAYSVLHFAYCVLRNAYGHPLKAGQVFICHSELREESLIRQPEILRAAQNDNLSDFCHSSQSEESLIRQEEILRSAKNDNLSEIWL